MKKYQLVEKKAAEAGLKLAVNWANVGGPSVMNDALLSGSADFTASLCDVRRRSQAIIRDNPRRQESGGPQNSP